MIIIRIEY